MSDEIRTNHWGSGNMGDGVKSGETSQRKALRQAISREIEEKTGQPARFLMKEIDRLAKESKMTRKQWMMAILENTSPAKPKFKPKKKP